MRVILSAMRRVNDLTRQTFGRLTVISRVTNVAGATRWHCICSCGKTSTPLSGDLNSGQSRSCGDKSHNKRKTHGKSRTAEYYVWSSMKARCNNSKHHAWKNYGGRGIRVCEHWFHSFENFLADMGERPDGLMLDRYPDNDGNYEPGNCRWGTREEQNLNRRLHKNNISGLSGVTRRSDKWYVQIVRNGKLHHLGVTDDFFEACCLRKSAEAKAETEASGFMAQTSRHGCVCAGS